MSHIFFYYKSVYVFQQASVASIGNNNCFRKKTSDAKHNVRKPYMIIF